MSNINLSPVSENPSSVRLSADDEKVLEQARKIIEKKFSIPPGFKLNKSNILRVALHEFVKASKNVAP